MKNTEENNKLIAEFMGWSKDNRTRDSRLWYNIPESLDRPFQDNPMLAIDMRFKYSWDWLMPVVEKIESFIFNDDDSFNVTIGSTNYCVIQDSNGEVYDKSEDRGSTKLETVYIAVVEFIEWHNKNK